LGNLGEICPISGVGPFLTGGAVHDKSACPHRVCSMGLAWILWKGKCVATGTAVGALTAIEQEVALACGDNPTKVTGSKKLLPRLSQIYNRWRKEDPPTTKQLPVEANVPELLAKKGRNGNATELEQAVGDLALIAFYYLLRIGEYTIKGK
jgi:hypothetical protein